MAKKSALPFVVNGYAQVEANRLTAMVNGEMESQAPAIDGAVGYAIQQPIENGMFLILNPIDALTPASTVAACPFGRMAQEPKYGAAEDTAYMVYNEKKIYDEREGYHDYVMDWRTSQDSFCYPRLFKITVGDVYTTNCINETGVALNDYLYVGNDGYLTKTKATNESICFRVTKFTLCLMDSPALCFWLRHLDN